MATTVVPDSSRVTVVAPKARVDLSIPTDIPLAHMLPTLLRHCGDELADTGATQGGWVLHRLGGPPLDTATTLGQNDVRDGEVLYFTVRAAVATELVFDDVADAVALVTEEGRGVWTLALTRRVAVILASAALIGGVVGPLFLGPPLFLGGGIALSLGIALVATATILSRVLRDRRASVLFSLVALCYAGVGGLLVLGGDRPLSELGAEHILVGATAITVYAAVLTLLTRGATALLLGATIAGVVLGIGAGAVILFGTSAAGAAAIIAAVGLVWIPFLPMLAARIARVPIPAVPTSPEDLKKDETTLDAVALRDSGRRAGGLLGGMVVSTAAILSGAEVVLALTGGVSGLLLCTVLAAVLMLRARPFVSLGPRFAVLGAGAGGLGLVAVVVLVSSDSLLPRAAVLTGLIASAVISLVYGLSVAGKRIAPIWGRALDIVEIILIVAAIPLAVWACGLYAWVRAIKA